MGRATDVAASGECSDPDHSPCRALMGIMWVSVRGCDISVLVIWIQSVLVLFGLHVT